MAAETISLEPVRLERLLVPLDGSRLAECVLGPAVSLAQHLRAALALLHVMERGAPTTVHGDRHLSAPGEAEAYLAALASRCPPHVVVQRHVHLNQEGDVAKSITDHAGDLGADLVILSTHGGGGARRVLFGSVAQQVLARGTRPVLLVRPGDLPPAPGTALPPWPVARVVVPLDGEPASEQALPTAVTIAAAYGAEVALVQVVPTVPTIPGPRGSAAKLVPTAAAASLQFEEDAARAALAALASRIRERGVAAQAEVTRGEPAQGVLDAAVRLGADLVAIATHARTGLDALLSGSVASRIGARFPNPLLLVRAPRSGPAAS
jgi:nucleotide-binding universal stress UspA family protein